MALETGAFMQASSYSAEIVRRAMFAQYARTSANNPGIISGGLIGATDFQISQLGSPNMSVNVSTGEAIVPGNEGGSQGGYYVRGTSTSNLPVSTANPTDPRVDTVCLTCGDTQYTLPSGGTSGALTLQVVTGTPTSDASLSNLSGVAALPGSSLLLGYVLVPAGASSIVTADISNVARTVQREPYAKLANGSAVSASNNTWTSLLFGSFQFGVALTASTSGFTIIRPGIYNMYATVTAGTGSGDFTVALTQNGAKQSQPAIPLSSSINVTQQVTCMFNCAVGDTLGVQALQTSGSSMNITAEEGACWWVSST